jgi:hypothetical protein
MYRLIILLLAVGFAMTLQAGPITYQGQLQDSSGPADTQVDIVFELYDQDEGGSAIASDSHTGVEVSDGLFQVELDFGSGNFDGGARWLQVIVDAQGLSPRQPITPTPMALHALNVSDISDTLSELDCAAGEIVKWYGSQWVCSADDDTTYTAGDGLALSGTTFSIDSDHTDGLYWRRGGNAGTALASDFLGTTDEVPFELHVDGQRALRLDPADVPNVIGGWEGNTVDTDIVGATIGGGGCPDLDSSSCTGERPNQVIADFGTIAGGMGNVVSGSSATVGGGTGNTASDSYATVGGGVANIASGFDATVGGGGSNTASDWFATVGGGADNIASAWYATVGGGDSNKASGLSSMVPGGQGNEASGNHSLAAGRWAKAGHDGAFVWADNAIADFASTGTNQFLIRAGGGVGINTNNPGSFDLAVDGSAAKPGGGSWATFSDARLKQNIQPVSAVAGSLLERLLELNTYAFEYTDEAVDTRLGLPGEHIGLLAQEVKEVFPEWVDTDEEGYLYVTERGTTAIVVEALREVTDRHDLQLAKLRAENAELREVQDEQLAELRKQVEANSKLAERNADLEDRLAALEALLLEDRQVAESQQ